MIVVVHMNEDVYIDYSATEESEKRFLSKLSKDFDIERSSAEDWPGQDNPNYRVHHWNVTPKPKRPRVKNIPINEN